MHIRHARDRGILGLPGRTIGALQLEEIVLNEAGELLLKIQGVLYEGLISHYGISKIETTFDAPRLYSATVACTR